MKDLKKIGIIICDRYRTCAGGKCFRAVRKREGAFKKYKKAEVEIRGYTTCDGCPGGNIEYALDEMTSNGVNVVHLATGLIVGYPPCPHIEYFHDFIEAKYDVKVVYGTHPIPEKYYQMHKNLNTWEESNWQEIIQFTLSNKSIRLSYN